MEMTRRLGKSEPTLNVPPIGAIRGDAVMAAERGHPFTSPAVSHSRDQAAAGQSPGNRIVRADAHQHSHGIHNLLRRVSSAVAASSARNAKFCVHSALPVDDGNDLSGLSI